MSIYKLKLVIIFMVFLKISDATPAAGKKRIASAIFQPVFLGKLHIGPLSVSYTAIYLGFKTVKSM
jgi:hypothetical protein